MLNILLGTADVGVRGHDPIVIKKIEYFTKLAQILDRTPTATVGKNFSFINNLLKNCN